jgi:hypothetical protein
MALALYLLAPMPEPVQLTNTSLHSAADRAGGLLADIIRFPGEVIERWFAGYLIGLGAVFLSSPGMFETLPDTYAELARGTFHTELHYGLLLCAIGAVQMGATFASGMVAKRARFICIILGAAVLIGFGEMFRSVGAMSGAFNYWFLGACDASQALRIWLLVFARKRGVSIETQVRTIARPLHPAL